LRAINGSFFTLITTEVLGGSMGWVSDAGGLLSRQCPDGWEHEVVVEKVLAADSEKRAVCLDGKNARPPEDCGGIFGYYDLLKAINNPKHPEHQQLLDWLGGPFDPSHFDLQETNSLLQGLKI
jgi:pRiA4b ORF-3-like protein